MPGKGENSNVNNSIYGNFGVNRGNNKNSKVNNSIYKNDVNNSNTNPRIHNEFSNNNASNPVSPSVSSKPNLKIRIPKQNLYNNANYARNNSSLTNENLNENTNADEVDTVMSNIEDSAYSTIRALNAGDEDAAIVYFKNFNKSEHEYIYITEPIMNTDRVSNDLETIGNLKNIINAALTNYEETNPNTNIRDKFLKVINEMANYKPMNRNNRKSKKTRKNRK
jgi:hypothetical protein